MCVKLCKMMFESLNYCFSGVLHQSLIGVFIRVSSWKPSGVFLADEAGFLCVAVRIVPRPVEDPQHLHAVLPSLAVVRLHVVPVLVGEWASDCAVVTTADVIEPVPVHGVFGEKQVLARLLLRHLVRHSAHVSLAQRSIAQALFVFR